jgi:hypothetical protein
MNLTEVIVCADQGGNDGSTEQTNGFVKVDISGIDENILLGSLVSGVGQDFGGISGCMIPREVSTLPREAASKVERQRSQLDDRATADKSLLYRGRESKDADNTGPAVCSSTGVTTTPCEHVHGHNVLSTAMRMKLRERIPRLEVKRKITSKYFPSKVWYPCFSGANSPFKHTHCSVMRKKDNPSIDVCYKS